MKVDNSHRAATPTVCSPHGVDGQHAGVPQHSLVLSSAEPSSQDRHKLRLIELTGILKIFRMLVNLGSSLQFQD